MGFLLSDGQLGREARPLPFPTSRNWLSGDTATAEGYHPTGMKPFTTEILSCRSPLSSRRVPEISTTITLFWSALTTKRVLPSGETATAQGVEPSGDPG